MYTPIQISSLKLLKLFKVSPVHSSSKITGMVLYFVLPYIISVHSLLSALTGSSAWCQLEGMAVMAKDSHLQRQITKASKNTSYPASRKKIKHIFIKNHFCLLPQLYAAQETAISFTSEESVLQWQWKFQWMEYYAWQSDEVQDYYLSFQTSALEVTNGKLWRSIRQKTKNPNHHFRI